MIMMYAGLRKSELIPLQWTDIDLSGKTIKVARFVEFSGNQAKVKNYGKSESAKRIVYIPDVLVDYLKGAKHDGFLSYAGLQMTKCTATRPGAECGKVICPS